MAKESSLSKVFKSVTKTSDKSETPQQVSSLTILTGIIVVIIYYKAYEYLDGLRSCSCAPKDLTTLKNLEMFFIVITALYVIINTIKYVSGKTQLIPQGSEVVINGVYLFFLLAIEIVYIYNVYTYIYSTNNCECMDHWEKYILYYQSVIYSLVPILILVLLLVIGFGPALAFLIIVACLVYYAIAQISETYNQRKRAQPTKTQTDIS
jgi:hypothetical protein